MDEAGRGSRPPIEETTYRGARGSSEHLPLRMEVDRHPVAVIAAALPPRNPIRLNLLPTAPTLGVLPTGLQIRVEVSVRARLRPTVWGPR